MKIVYTTLGDAFCFEIKEPFPEYVEVKNETKIVSCHGTNNECCYGIASIDGINILGKRMAIENVPDHSKLMIFDKQWKHTGDIILPDCKDIHQIIPYRKHILSTSARTNEIFVTNLMTGKSTMSFLPDPLTLSTERIDLNHINSMFIADSSIYLYCHNHGESMILEVDLDSVFLADTMRVKKRWDNVGRKGHCVVVVGNSLLSLNSGQGKLMCHDMDSGEKKHVINLDGRYLRGLEIAGDYLLVGGSYQDKDREERFQDKDIMIFILDKHTLAIKSRLAFTKKKNILDIRSYNDQR